MGHFAYLASFIFFCGSTFAYLYYRKGIFIRQHFRAILIVCVFGIPFAAAEAFALHWRAWAYNPEKTFGVFFGAALESYLFIFGVFGCVAAVTMVLAEKIDKEK